MIELTDPYFKTPKVIIDKKLELLNLKEGDLLYDLGCGNADALITACQKYNVTCIGYELLPEAIDDAKENIKKHGLNDRITIKTEDFFQADISNATAMILYLTRKALGEISLRLENELPVGARIITHDFDLPAWTPKEHTIFTLPTGKTVDIYLYEK